DPQQVRIRPHHGNHHGTEVSVLKRELLHVRKVAAPAWKTCQRVSRQIAKCRYQADERKVREWKFILDDARVVYWSDLPQRLRHRWKEFTGLLSAGFFFWWSWGWFGAFSI